MSPRFDEVDLRRPAGPSSEATAFESQSLTSAEPASRTRRAVASLIDWSLFAALALAMSPLLPLKATAADTLTDEWPSLAAFTGFILLIAFYYAVGAWTIWGKTIGGAITDVRITDMQGSAVSVASAARRFAATLLSILTGGLGFLPALAGERRSFPDRFSNTRSVRG